MRKVIMVLSALMLLVSTVSAVACAEDYGTAGSIQAEERNPEEGDHSNWLTIRSGEIGVRVVAQDGKELVAIDNYGGIYLNGDVYLNQKLLNTDTLESGEQEPGMSNTENGFVYLLLVVCIASNVYCVVTIRKMKKS